MNTIDNTSIVNLTDTIDQLLTLKRWAKAHHRMAIDISEDQFKQQLSRLHFVEVWPLILSTAHLQNETNKHWIAARLLSALDWQRRQLAEIADKLCDTLHACALHAETDRALYYYQRMSAQCNELCCLAIRARILEKKIAPQLFELGVEDALPYLSNQQLALH